MDLDGLRAFVAIARSGSFSRAADELHRSQPAISRRIEMLEAELGTPLFERIRGRVATTDAGAALLPHAEAALAAAKDGADAVRALRSGDEGTVALALVGTLANAAITGVLRRFADRFPKVRLSLSTATSQEVARLVQRGAANLGLTYPVASAPDLDDRVIAHEALIVVCARGHPLPGDRSLTPFDLRAERWVAFPDRPSGESFVRLLQRQFARADLGEAEVVPIDSLTAQKRLVEAGYGLALLAESGVQEELAAGTLRRLEVPALRSQIPVSVLTRRGGYLGPAARALLAEIEAGLGNPA